MIMQGRSRFVDKVRVSQIQEKGESPNVADQTRPISREMKIKGKKEEKKRMKSIEAQY